MQFGSAEFWWDACVDVYFISDIVINFRTPFYDERGVPTLGNNMSSKIHQLTPVLGSIDDVYIARSRFSRSTSVRSPGTMSSHGSSWMSLRVFRSATF